MNFALGIEGLLTNRRLLTARAVGLVSHDAARLRDGRSAAEALQSVAGSRLRALFGPEHGFAIRGAAGEQVAHSRHPEWDIPIWSLYGEQRKPSPEMLHGLDLLVVDLHTLPFRPYTYLATLRNVMQAAGETGLPVIVADRPVPMPDTIDGPMPDQDQFSFVCPAPLPMAYGMTLGETARWLQPQLDPQPDLHVSAMTGYHRETGPGPDWPPWVPPSPAIRAWDTAACYLVTVFCEALPLFTNNRQGDLAFQLLHGPPEWDAGRKMLADRFNEKDGLRVSLTDPESRTNRPGIRLHVTDPGRLRPVRAALDILSVIQQSVGTDALWQYPGTRPEFFDRLFGTRHVREALQSGKPPAEIADEWTHQCAQFNKQRTTALLY